MREARLESVLKVSPELIEPSFLGCQVEAQLRRGKCRLDLLVHHLGKAIIVEIKKTRLEEADVEQLLNYCHIWSKDRKYVIADEGYLVGLPPLRLQKLKAVVGEMPFKLNFRFLGVHIPKIVQDKDRGGYEKWEEGSKKTPLRLAL